MKNYDKILDLCKENKIKIGRLEKECNISNNTIRRWKHSNPKATTLKKVADYFGKPVDFFLE